MHQLRDLYGPVSRALSGHDTPLGRRHNRQARGARKSDPWRAEVLVIPQSTLRHLFKAEPELENILLQIALEETQSQLQTSENSRRLTEIVCLDNLTVEARPHLNEIAKIIAGSHVGYGPAQDDSLGPFSALHRYIATTGLMKSRTLKNRIPGFIVPKEFNPSGDATDYFYHSFNKPASQSKCYPPTKTSRVLEAIAQGLSRFQSAVNVPELQLQFVASEKQPKAAIAIHPVAGNEQINRDFAEQLKLAESVFGLDKSMALGDPRTGFLGRFVRVSRPQFAQSSKAGQNRLLPKKV